MGNLSAAIKALNVPRGTSKRFSCPNCGGANTLSVGWKGSTLVWLCFRASCGLRGKEAASLTLKDIEILQQKQKDEPKPFVMPSYFTSVMSDERAISFLKRNNCIDAYTSNRAAIRYDPRENRVVFLIYHRGSLVDAAGRILTPGVKPKWKRYGHAQYPFVCGDSTTAVLVEDCASACAVSSVATGIALLGTNLTAGHMQTLRSYKECIVALDPDAHAKAARMVHVVSPYLPTKVALISDDLKYFDNDKIRQELNLV